MKKQFPSGDDIHLNSIQPRGEAANIGRALRSFVIADGKLDDSEIQLGDFGTDVSRTIIFHYPLVIKAPGLTSMTDITTAAKAARI